MNDGSPVTHSINDEDTVLSWSGSLSFTHDSVDSVQFNGSPTGGSDDSGSDDSGSDDSGSDDSGSDDSGSDDSGREVGGGVQDR
ncbi:MAG: hypothetical protein ACI9VR_001313 [Cognaticolwellia sp.]|jgi:hypothetical protein